MLQTPVLDFISFDPFSFQQDDLATSEIGVCRREIVEALVIALVVVVIDEGLDAGPQVTRLARNGVARRTAIR